MPRYIDAEEANKIMLNAMCGTGYQSRAMSAIDDTPTADVQEVKHGYWIIKPHGFYLHMGAFCSSCGEHSGIGGIEKNQRRPYCPNCGAKMDGKESGE